MKDSSMECIKWTYTHLICFGSRVPPLPSHSLDLLNKTNSLGVLFSYSWADMISMHRVGMLCPCISPCPDTKTFSVKSFFSPAMPMLFFLTFQGKIMPLWSALSLINVFFLSILAIVNHEATNPDLRVLLAFLLCPAIQPNTSFPDLFVRLIALRLMKSRWGFRVRFTMAGGSGCQGGPPAQFDGGGGGPNR